MTQSQYNSILDDELLSAYIDGELTDAERADVEARLVTDPAARELVAEMRSLSGALKSLPRESLADDLRGAVLRQIGDRQVSLPPVKLSMVHRLMWPAIAIAAALMLMFVQDYQDRQVDKVAKVEAGAAERRDRELEGEAGAAFEAPAEESTMREAAAQPAAPASTAGDHVLSAQADALPDESAARDALNEAIDEPAIAARRMTDAIEASDAELEGVVHLTLTDFREGADRFNKLLISNGVQLVDQAPVPPASVAAPAAAAPTNDTFAAQPDAGTMATRSAVPKGGVGGGTVSTSPVEGTDLEADAPPAEPEMVLVEAPPKQIEQILFGCAQDTEAIAEVTVDPTASGINATPSKQRFSEYQQYSRSSITPALGTQYHVTPQQQGVIAALNSLPKQAAVQPNDADQQAAWAARLYTEQPFESDKLNWQYNQYRSQYFDNRARQQAVARGESTDISKKLAKEKTTSDEPLRVLFLLHPSTEAAKK